MAHPLVAEILNLARPIAADLGLELVGATFHTHYNPPLLRLDIRNLTTDTSLDDCERFSRAVDGAIEAAEAISEAYTLEVSSPGLSDVLESDREFVSFKGFETIVTTRDPYKGKTQWLGSLVGRDETTVKIAQKGRTIAIPRELVQQVKLVESLTEDDLI